MIWQLCVSRIVLITTKMEHVLKERKIVHPWEFRGAAVHYLSLLVRITGKLPKHHASAIVKSRIVFGTLDFTAT